MNWITTRAIRTSVYKCTWTWILQDLTLTKSTMTRFRGFLGATGVAGDTHCAVQVVAWSAHELDFRGLVPEQEVKPL